MSSDVGTLLAPNVKLFARLICRSDPVGTVITTGDQAVALELALAHVAVDAATIAPQVYPHMGTDDPSGRLIVDAPAAKLTCCCATVVPSQRSRIVAATPPALYFVLALSCIVPLLTLIRLVDHEFTRIYEQHHHHSPGKDIVSGDLAFVVR